MYDITVAEPEDWSRLKASGLQVVVDPLIYRLGEFFLEGARGAGHERDLRWGTLTSDLGALISFFDLIVLNDKLPAFNYFDTFDSHLPGRDPLGEAVNVRGDTVLVHVDAEHSLYRQVKESALYQLKDRISEGPFVPQAAADELLKHLAAVRYEWEPRLEFVDDLLPNMEQKTLARFLLGQLVFAGYAQQTGAPHVLSPRRSFMLTAVGLRAASADDEAVIYRELRRRIEDAGVGWRGEDLPWTPSFLPYLLERMNEYREGPQTLLHRARDLRTKKAVEDYRQLRANFLSGDSSGSAEAKAELSAAADKVARALDSERGELELTRSVFVEVTAKAVGIGVGAAVGAVFGGPPGALLGGFGGLASETVLTRVQQRLWGWVIDRIPFYSAGKLLTRAVKAERNIASELETKLHRVWEN
jgi:hypothetical protein